MTCAPPLVTERFCVTRPYLSDRSFVAPSFQQEILGGLPLVPRGRGANGKYPKKIFWVELGEKLLSKKKGHQFYFTRSGSPP